MSVCEGLVGQAIAYAFLLKSNARICFLLGDDTSIIEKAHDFIVVFPHINRSTVTVPIEIKGVLRELHLLSPAGIVAGDVIPRIFIWVGLLSFNVEVNFPSAPFMVFELQPWILFFLILVSVFDSLVG